jgi:hypothetical protein
MSKKQEIQNKIHQTNETDNKSSKQTNKHQTNIAVFIFQL